MTQQKWRRNGIHEVLGALQEELDEELKKAGVEMLAISQTKTEEKRIYKTKNGHMIIYSGVEKRAPSTIYVV